MAQDQYDMTPRTAPRTRTTGEGRRRYYGFDLDNHQLMDESITTKESEKQHEQILLAAIKYVVESVEQSEVRDMLLALGLIEEDEDVLAQRRKDQRRRERDQERRRSQRRRLEAAPS